MEGIENNEIAEALKQFEVKEKEAQQFKTQINPQQKGISKMAQLVIKWGLAKDEKGANAVLLFFTVVFFIISGYFFYVALGGNKSKAPAVNKPALDQMGQMPSVR